MKLSQLLEKADVESSYEDVEITYVTDKAENCRQGCAFVCIKGKNSDGHDLVHTAEKNGASVFITERNTGRENQIKVKNTRKAYAYMCSRFFGSPSEKLKVIAVTGTNGKTTTAYMIYGLLTLSGVRAGLMGTVENLIGGESCESDYTTPDAFEFNRMLAEMVSCGTECCVCEVSSQALDQYRTYGCEFFAGVFTNITHEHLDYHGSFENYLSAKKKLFSFCKYAIINLDDPHSKEIIASACGEVTTFSVRKDEADLTAKSIKYSLERAEYVAVTYSNIARVKVTGIGEYTVGNSLAALAVMLRLGFDFCEVCERMKLLKPVRGRGERLDITAPYSVIIDYAHTPDALYNVLYALSSCKKGRLIVLFGCGGNRDKEKRADMGNIASYFADIVIVTNDNPRDEDEDEIISDILGGVDARKCRLYVEKDRTKAIKLALTCARKDDIVLIAGKGHEAFQIIKDKKIPFDEREKVTGFLR